MSSALTSQTEHLYNQGYDFYDSGSQEAYQYVTLGLQNMNIHQPPPKMVLTVYIVWKNEQQISAGQLFFQQ